MLHPAIFQIKDTVSLPDMEAAVAKFNTIPGIKASIKPFLGEEFLKRVDWPNKSEDFSHCLTVAAESVEALKTYLHSKEHADWIPLVHPHMKTTLFGGPPGVVFDTPLTISA